MGNFINNLTIRNFKSIRHLEMDCRRINLLIGKPNVGKSNVLEAISLLGAGAKSSEILFEGRVRLNTLHELFHFRDIANPITIQSDLGFVVMKETEEKLQYLICDKADEFKYIAEKLSRESDLVGIWADHFRIGESTAEEPLDRISESTVGTIGMNQSGSENTARYSRMPVRPYQFTKPILQKASAPAYLQSPFGDNFLYILETNPKLREAAGRMFRDYDLDLVLDAFDGDLHVQKREGHLVYKLRYNLTADTLQRVIFHLAAIYSNDNSVLVFEEPEAHSYPPYIKTLAEEIIASESNQFFIATHSPYILNTILENASVEDVAVFLGDYQNHETSLHRMSDNKLSEVLDDGINLFFNLNWAMDD